MRGLGLCQVCKISNPYTFLKEESSPALKISECAVTWPLNSNVNDKF